MTTTWLVAGLALVFMSGTAGQSSSAAAAAGTSCEGLTALMLTNAQIVSASSRARRPVQYSRRIRQSTICQSSRFLPRRRSRHADS